MQPLEIHKVRLVRLYFLLGGIHVVLGLLSMVLSGSSNGEADAIQEATFASTVGSLVTLLLVASGALTLTAGWMMVGRRTGAQGVGLAAAFLLLFAFPLGTVLGSYGIWVLLHDRPESPFAA